MDFNNCLISGKEKEILVLKYIRDKYPKAHIVEGNYKYGDIYIPELDMLVEVKFDIISEKTGNFLFEVSCGDNASGISTTKSSWWAIVDSQVIHFIKLEDIYNCVEKNEILPKQFQGEFGRGEFVNMSGYVINKGLLPTFELHYGEVK